jgi:hypothetical protein
LRFAVDGTDAAIELTKDDRMVKASPSNPEKLLPSIPVCDQQESG